MTDSKAAFEYLLDNLEEVALEVLSYAPELAGEMERAALELHEEYSMPMKKRKRMQYL